MKSEVTTLSNGMTLVTHRMPHLETSSLGIWVGVGARHEKEHEHGLSHLLEHMAFKGTSRRSAQQIAEEIEAVGGDLNAATSLETTAYFSRVLKGDEGIALEILADILQHSTYAGEELDREREVILQEIAALRDSPDEIAYDLVHDAAFPGQPVGRPIIGTPASVRAISQADLRAFMAQHYRPGAMVLAAAGPIDHDALARLGEALFGGLINAPSGSEQPARYQGGIRAHNKRFEQSHLVLGFEGPSYVDTEIFTAQVFSGLFGGGMSSRLFQEVRERRGLCYSIYSSVWGLKDSGMFGVHAATGAEMMGELIDIIGAELKRAANEEPTAGEVARAKAQLKAGLLMSLESSSARSEQLARHILAYGRPLTPEELVASVEAVTPERLRLFAARLAGGQPSAVVVGAGRRSQEFAQRAEQSFAG